MTDERALDPELFRLQSAFDGPALLGSRSVPTGRRFWPARLTCPETGGSVETVELNPRGALRSWTFVHLPWSGQQQLSSTAGYGIGEIDLADGPRVIAPLFGDHGDWTIGQPMAICRSLVRVDGDGVHWYSFAFAPVAGATGTTP